MRKRGEKEAKENMQKVKCENREKKGKEYLMNGEKYNEAGKTAGKSG